ncbi:MAG TPA: glycoside hydrolase family 13 protein [Nocardioidaceae bacterium]|nr:glycoside hydrolase family 13 protein [Nocardioidaceae bacterium]
MSVAPERGQLSEASAPWWRDAVCYEVYVRSFADSDGDGVGDLPGVTSRLPYLHDLGVDAVWLTPFYPSPLRDAGYDVTDHRDVDRRLGTLADFDGLLAAAHRLGLRVIVDVVPNHTSSEHPWFQAALADRAGGPARARYHFRDGRGRGGARPPNNWQSRFGGPAWTRVGDGQWYLHLFDAAQPDLDWQHPDVRADFERTLRWWLDRGVDGFRIDVAHGLCKAAGLPDWRPGAADHPAWDQPEVHEIYRDWHRTLGGYAGDRMAVAEAWVRPPARMARYLRPDELQQAFNFAWLQAPWSATAFRGVIEATYDAVDPAGASPTWVLSNHDVVRTVTRYGDGAVGPARARAALLVMLMLPGSAYLYQGEELGLPQAYVAPGARRDPTWLRGGGVGRDGCRVPVPWAGGEPPYGFSPPGAAEPWLPQPPDWARLTVAAELGEPGSMLSFVRAALAARREHCRRLGSRVALGRSRPGLLVVDRAPGLTCVLNSGSRARPLPRYADPAGLLICSSNAAAVAGGRIPPNTAAWFQAAG